LSNIDELPDLAGDVRDRAVPPPYEQVTRRVRAPRLRTATGTMAAAVITVGGIAVWQNAATTASPSPAPPITQPADPAYPASPEWRQVVAGTDSHPFDTQGTDDGSIAVVWRALEHPEPTFALVIREPDGTVHGRRLDSPVSLTPVPGGWVGLRTERAWFIATDGTWTDLGEPGPSRSAQPGDVFVRGQDGVDRLYSPQDRTWSTFPTDYGDVGDAYVTPDGEVITCSVVGRTHVWVTMRQVHSPWIDGSSCVVAGRENAVSAIGLGDDPDGGIPLTGMLVRTQDGSEFDLGDFVALTGVSSLTVTPTGSTVVTDASTGDAFILTADRSREMRRPDRKFGLAFVAGDRLYATSYAQGKAPLLYSDDDGATWQETTLPGLE
jgi:hypothetical protein